MSFGDEILHTLFGFIWIILLGAIALALLYFLS